MRLNWPRLFVLYSTCFISFFGVLLHAHPIKNNRTHLSTYSLQNTETNHSIRSSSLTSASNGKPNVYASTFRLKSTSNINHESNDLSEQSSLEQMPPQSLQIHPVVNNDQLYVQASTPFHLSKSAGEGSNKIVPIHELNDTPLQSPKAAPDLPGSPSGTKSFGSPSLNSLTSSKKADKLQDHSSNSLKASDLQRSLSSRVKRSVGDAPSAATTLAAHEVVSVPTNQSNTAQDSEDKDSKPSTIANNDNGSSFVSGSAQGTNKDNSILNGIGQTDGEMPNNALTSGAMLRGFIVFVGCSVIVMVYLGLKFVCSRRQRRYSKVSRADDLDLLPLTEEGDEEDEEIFSANRRS